MCHPGASTGAGRRSPGRRQTTFDQHFAAFLQVLVAGFCLFAPGGDAEPDGLLDLVAIRAGVLPVDRNAEVGHRLPAGCVAHLGIAAEITHK